MPFTITYSCGDFDLAKVFCRETDPPTVVLTTVGRQEGADQVLACMRPSGRGPRYEGANVSIREHHGEPRLAWLGKDW